MENKSVPYVAYESALMHSSKANKRLTIICVILVIALILSNLAWIIYEKQFETVEETTEEYYDYDVDQKSDNGDNNFIGRDGNIINGNSEGKS